MSAQNQECICRSAYQFTTRWRGRANPRKLLRRFSFGGFARGREPRPLRRSRSGPHRFAKGASPQSGEAGARAPSTSHINKKPLRLIKTKRLHRTKNLLRNLSSRRRTYIYLSLFIVNITSYCRELLTSEAHNSCNLNGSLTVFIGFAAFPACIRSRYKYGNILH